jgi:hypothetical protein
LFKWGKGRYALADILEPGEVTGKGKVWVFVVERQAGAGESSIERDAPPRQSVAR